MNSRSLIKLLLYLPACVLAPMLVGHGPSFAQDNWIASTLSKSESGLFRIVVSGRDRNGERRQQAFGTAFLVHNNSKFDKGYLVTAAHVIGNPRTEWLVENGVPERTIAVQRLSGTGPVVVEANAAVVSEDHNTDVAVLEIRLHPGTAIPIRTLNSLAVGEQLALFGFPVGSNAAVPVSGIVRRVDAGANLSFDVNLVASQGQSGGPILGRNGQAVGIASSNNDKSSARWHTAAPAILAQSALNDYLRKRGWPELQFEDTECSMYGATAGAETRFHSTPHVTVNISFLDAMQGCRITRVEHEIERQYNFSELKIEIVEGGKRAKVTFNLFDRPRPGYVKLHYRVFQERWNQ